MRLPRTDDSSPAPRALRADAERRRRKVLEVARLAFREHGLDASLEDIARRAGVGIGTLYRRYPTRADLISASFELEVAKYRQTVSAAAAQPEAWPAFCALIVDLCRMQIEDAGFRELLTFNAPASPGVEHLKRDAREDLRDLVARAKEEGGLRADFEASDVLLMMLAFFGVAEATHELAPNAVRRLAAYLIDAFRADRAHTLPPPESDQAMDAALTRSNR